MNIMIPVVPMGTVRTTHKMIQRIKFYTTLDKKAETVKRYLAYKQELSYWIRLSYKKPMIEGPVELNLTFYMPMPGHWSERMRERMEGKLHTKRPDRDNLEKGVCDAMNKICFNDDGQVCMGTTIKRYSVRPRIEIEVREAS